MTKSELVGPLTYRMSRRQPLTTSEAARLVGLSGPRALRQLERRGLVPAPAARSRARGYRVYTASDITAIRARLAKLDKVS